MMTLIALAQVGALKFETHKLSLLIIKRESHKKMARKRGTPRFKRKIVKSKMVQSR